MALVGSGDPAAPAAPAGLVFTDFGGDGGEPSPALGGGGGGLGPPGAGFGGGQLGHASASFGASPPTTAAESMPIAIPGGHVGLRRPGGLGGPGE